MNIQEEYPDFFGDAPIYSTECFKQNNQVRENSFIEIITLEIVNTVNNEDKLVIND
jgi:hypothetical protein